MVVVRAAIDVDPGDSHLTIDSDPLPQMLQGIPLRLREVHVAIDRPGFIFNPSSCAPLEIHGTLTASTARCRRPSPVPGDGCAALPFSPKLTANADGQDVGRQRRGLKVT